MTGVGKSEAIKADEATRAHLEAYAHTLEMKLAKKKALLNEATKLHDSLAARLFRLEEGLSLKDVQLESLTRQNEEVREESSAWRQRAVLLEEENAALRDALLERSEEYNRLLQIVEAMPHQGSARLGPSDEPAIQRMVQQLKDSRQKAFLLEEQLRLRSGPDADRGAPELSVFPDLDVVSPADAWARVGRGAADRICGSTPHVDSEDPESRATTERSARSKSETEQGLEEWSQSLSPKGRSRYFSMARESEASTTDGPPTETQSVKSLEPSWLRRDSGSYLDLGVSPAAPQPQQPQQRPMPQLLKVQEETAWRSPVVRGSAQHTPTVRPAVTPWIQSYGNPIAQLYGGGSITGGLRPASLSSEHTPTTPLNGPMPVVQISSLTQPARRTPPPRVQARVPT